MGAGHKWKGWHQRIIDSSQTDGNMEELEFKKKNGEGLKQFLKEESRRIYILLKYDGWIPLWSEDCWNQTS